jgi:hypothetical protein
MLGFIVKSAVHKSHPYQEETTLKSSTKLFIGITLLACQQILAAQTIVEHGTSSQYQLGPSGKLRYSEDAKGNRIPDFSYVGYHSGEKAIPTVPVKITLAEGPGDDTQRIQDALNKLGTLPEDKDGLRGALLLKRGVYRVAGRLSIFHSGTVLRGEGNGPDGTIIVATGYGDPKYQRTLITVGPDPNDQAVHSRHGYPTKKLNLVSNSMQRITDAYVPVGTHTFTVQSAEAYKPDDRIVVYRPSTAAWIHLIGCDQLKPRWFEIRNARWVKEGNAPGLYFQRTGNYSKNAILQREDESWEDFVKRMPFSEDGKTFDITRQWEAGDYDFYFERRITAITGNQITIDAPIVHSMEQQYGGGAIYHYETPGRVTEVGIENLRLISEFAAPTPDHPEGDPSKTRESEYHAWHGIQLKHNTKNTWVRDITGNYFGWSLVSASGKNATIQDCVNLGHASRIEGGRRYPFMINGQRNLVQRCLTFEGRHEFVTQKKTAGPNVFVDCLGIDSKNNAGPHHRYAIGTLFDNVKSEKPMESRFRGNSGTGHGWAATQTYFYNCTAPEFLVDAPPGGIAWVIGSAPENTLNARATPPSLYYQQVQDRLGKKALEHLATEEQRENLGTYRWAKKRLKKEKRSID